MPAIAGIQEVRIPNNIPIEFSAPVAAVDLRRHPRMMDRSPSAAAAEGPDPQPGHWPEVTAATPLEDRIVYTGEGAVFAGKETD